MENLYGMFAASPAECDLECHPIHYLSSARRPATTWPTSPSRPRATLRSSSDLSSLYYAMCAQNTRTKSTRERIQNEPQTPRLYNLDKLNYCMLAPRGSRTLLRAVRPVAAILVLEVRHSMMQKLLLLLLCQMSEWMAEMRLVLVQSDATV